jgi:effector-binding domain-containing protein
LLLSPPHTLYPEFTEGLDSPLTEGFILFSRRRLPGIKITKKERIVFKIGDFSRLSFVTVKTLRYYDEIGLLKPVEVDRFTGYRYYSAEQLPRLNYIVALKELGLSLDEVAILVKDSLSPAQMRDIFILKKAELQQRVAQEQNRLERVERLLRRIEKEGTMPEYQITIKKLEPMLVASVRDTVPSYGDCGPLFGEIYKYLAKKFVFKPADRALMLCHDGEYKERDVDIEIAIPIGKKIKGSDRVKVYELPAVEKAACTIHKGPYDTISEAYSAIMSWCEANGYETYGQDREIFLTNPHDLKDPSKNITEVQFPVKKVS